MEFRDLKQQYTVLKPQMDAAIGAVLESTHFISGPQVGQLEEKLAAYAGRKYCITCANGTDALVLVLRAWGIGPGDAVFVPDFTFFASAECVSNVGATPVFVDVDETTFNMDPASLRLAIEGVKAQGGLTPRVVIPVDLFGLPADYDAIAAIARAHGLLVLEDAAQGFGGHCNGKMACGFGDASTVSFFPAKPLGCYGDGGAIFTDSDEEAALIRSFAVHGKGTDKYDNVRIGYNSRLDTVQAAILLVKLAAFDEEVAATYRAASQYTALLKDAVKTPVVPKGYFCSWAQYTIQLKDAAQRDKVAAALKAQGIPTNIYYPRTMRRQTAYKDSLPAQVVHSPTAEKLCERVLALPIHPYLTPELAAMVANAVLAAL